MSDIRVPFFDTHIDQDDINAVVDTLRSQWISIGPVNEKLENIFKRKIGSRFALTTSSCTSALHLALLALGIAPGDEVIVPSLTFVATVSAVTHVGAIPVFADIESPFELTLSPEYVEKSITIKTKAVIIMHYGGFSGNIKAIQKLCKEKKIYLIEDAAHAIDSLVGDQHLGTFGDVGCFSFFSNKNITCAEGGMLICDSETVYKSAKLFRSHGMRRLSFNKSKGHLADYDIGVLGYNYRMDDIRASLLLSQLDKLSADTKKREHIRRLYVERLKNLSVLKIPFINYKGRSSNHLFPVILSNPNRRERRTIRMKLAEKGIQTSIHYPAVHRFSYYKHTSTDLPITEQVADTEISLPIFYHLTDEQIDYVCSCLKEVLGEEGR
jgi:dTDP-4-amino-4,6-dideoxygalactose transaminase